MRELTPMMRQYLAVKEKYKDAILFYRLGDFYEMFFDDAEKASKLLNLTLTSRNRSEEEPIPFCGVPHQTAQTYINKLVALGHKVAVCEQMEDPKKVKGIVKREVVQVVTPGLNLDLSALEGRSNNHLVSLVPDNGRWGVASVDISTGSFRVTQFDSTENMEAELARLEPSELIINDSHQKGEWVDCVTRLFPSLRLSPLKIYSDDADYLADQLRDYYQIPFESFGLMDKPLALKAAGLILTYLSDTKLLCDRLLSPPTLYHLVDYLLMDGSVKKNLELTRTLAEGNVHGSLFWLLDEAQTAMGSRKIKEGLLYPLIDLNSIRARHTAVDELVNAPSFLEDLRKKLKGVGDLERIENRILASLATARDLIELKESLNPLPEIREQLASAQSSLLRDTFLGLDPLQDLRGEINRVLVDDPPLALREGGLIREGVHPELDQLRCLERDGKSFIAAMEAREREVTGISSLKIRYNRVFGYSIEITHTHRSKIPPHYIRKQTLTQAERYVTPELKEYEEKILGAAEKICEIEYEEFVKLRNRAAREGERVKKTAAHLATLDALSALAHLARERGYIRPEMVEEPIIDIKKGRHPLVEALLPDPFVPNDVYLNTEEQRLLVITGPNMAGKSTVMRQTALICIMAQMGGFVPAESARLGVVDRIFTRIGASDHLQKGQSTFMVEMLETSQILSQATERSLVILDEIGRGTSTFDGLSIAWAVAETLHDKIRARTLFATHYHELTDLASEKEGIKNFHMAVSERGGKILFLRELVKGGTNRSYGVHVAGMAGLPLDTIKRAREILRILEEKDLQFKSATQKIPYQPTLFENPTNPVLEEIKRVDLNLMTPLEALNFLARLQENL